MADYRQISQDYARAAVNTSVLLNGGAAVAFISQIGSLVSSGFGPLIIWPLALWATGAFLAGITYPLAFLSARHVDRSERAEAKSKKEKEIKVSDRYMYSGIVTTIGSFLLFGFGCAWLTYQFKQLFG
jgi:hypothetical protein